MAYFDNAATTYPKPDCVYDFMDSFYRSSGANAGRGNYKLAQSAGALIGDTRKKIQELLHCQAKQVVFEPTATIALNIIIQGIIEKGAVNIYISPFEHNAVTRTLHHFEEQGKIKVTQLTVSKSMVFLRRSLRLQPLLIKILTDGKEKADGTIRQEKMSRRRTTELRWKQQRFHGMRIRKVLRCFWIILKILHPDGVRQRLREDLMLWTCQIIIS